MKYPSAYPSILLWSDVRSSFCSKSGAYGAYRPVKMGLYRPNGHAGDGGDIGQVHLLDKTHQENAALLAGEFLQGFVDHLHSFSGDQLRFGRAFAAGQVLAHVAGIDRIGRGRLPEAKFLALGVVAYQVERDPHQPGGYAAIAAKLISSQVSLEQAILGDRLRCITV